MSAQDYIKTTIEIPRRIAELCAQLCNIPRESIHKIEFAIFIQQALQYYVDQQLAEPVPPSGHCDWCGTYVEQGITVADIARDSLELVCPQCMAKAATLMKAKAELQRPRLLANPKSVLALKRAWAMEYRPELDGGERRNSGKNGR